MSRITWNGLTLNCGFTLIYKILTKASLAVSCISMLVHWPSRLYKYCDLNCTTNMAKVQISVATPTGKEKTSLYTIYVCSCFTVHIEKNLIKRGLIRVKHNVYQQHSKTFKKWKKLIFSKTYHCSKMDVEIRMLSHAVTQVCSSHLQLSGISHKRKITVKWQMPSKLASKVKEYSHLWPHGLHKFLQAGMKLSELALGNVKWNYSKQWVWEEFQVQLVLINVFIFLGVLLGSLYAFNYFTCLAIPLWIRFQFRMQSDCKSHNYSVKYCIASKALTLLSCLCKTCKDVLEYPSEGSRSCEYLQGVMRQRNSACMYF